ncbi:unnamed protein product [Polarella glacialis]|uniref:Uncharacterized protein n=1 Tax=Polarella glacialis TaxID=89957 RepID=A0A813JIZ3_POLGL|nr:unnamed protein product [Polarella glacialis]
MATDEQLARTIAMLVAEQCDKQVVALFTEIQKKLSTHVESAVFNQLVQCRVVLSASDGKSSSSVIAQVLALDRSAGGARGVMMCREQKEESCLQARSFDEIVLPVGKEDSETVDLPVPPSQVQASAAHVAPYMSFSPRGTKQHSSFLKVPAQSQILPRLNSVLSQGSDSDSELGADSSQPPMLPPAVMILSEEQEEFRRSYRKLRSNGSMGEVNGDELKDARKLHKPFVKSSPSSRRGLCAMEMARLQALVPARVQVRTPSKTPPTLPLAILIPSQGEATLARNTNSSPKQNKTMSQAWADQDKSLAQHASANDEEVRKSTSTPWWLSLFGFQQSQGRRAIVMDLYMIAIFCCIGAAVATQFLQMYDPGFVEGRFGNEVILVMGFCSVASFLQLNFRRPGHQSAAQATSEVFMNNVTLPEYVDLWLERSRWSSCEVAFLWFLSLAAETAAVDWTSDKLDPGKAIVHLTVYAAVTAAFSGLALYLLHVCNAQAGMVDHYSATAAELSEDYAVLRHRWDQIQAILRRSAQCLTPCLLTLTLSPVIVVVATTIEFIVDSEHNAQKILLELFPKTFVLLGTFRVLSRIGEVTGNCDRLPVFLNSLLLGDGFDEKAHHLVFFIERSKAGFYVFDAKVDYTVLSKFAYVISAGLLAPFTKALKF